MLGDQWVKSSKSDILHCVEVRRVGGFVELRDSKAPDQLTLRFTVDEWRAFVDHVNDGAADVE